LLYIIPALPLDGEFVARLVERMRKETAKF